MANNNLGKQAIEEVVAAFDELNATLPKTIKGLKEVARSGQLPSDFATDIKTVVREMKRLEAAGGKLDSGTKKIISSANQYVNILEREKRALEKTTGLYRQTEQKLSRLKKEYRDLAIAKQLNQKLNNKEVETLNRLQKEITDVDKALKQVDAGMGQYNRSVGSYGKAFDSLGFSVAQITREAPAFLISMNTGFMAISNNIPILVDELNKLKIANQKLAAQGKPTVSVLKQLGSAIFSWQSAISAGIVALTVLGPKLIEWAKGTGDVKKEMDDLNEEIQEQNDLLDAYIQKLSGVEQAKLGGTLSSQKEIAELKEANKFISNTNNSLGDRQKVLDDLNKRYEKYTGTLKLTDFEQGNAQESLNNLIGSLEDKAQAEELLNKIGEERQRILKITNAQTISEGEALEKISELQEDQVYWTEQLKIARDARSQERATEKISSIQREINKLTKIANGDSEFANELAEQKAKAQENINKLSVEYQKLLASSIIKEIEAGKLSKEDIERLGLQAEGVNSLRKEIEKKIKLLEQLVELYADNDGAVAKHREEIELLKQAIKGIPVDVKDAMSEAEAYLNRKGGVLNPLPETQSNWEKYFLALVPIARNTFQLIADIQKAATQQQLADLEKQKDLAIGFAGESAAAREQIEEQFAKKEAAIRKKQAVAEKKQALFNIALNTAQAVVAALKIPPVPAFSIIVGALGAAQLAFAAAQPIPEFAEGVRDFGGGLAIVGDGGRSEVVRTPDGKVFKTPSTDTLVNLPKGSDVFSSEDEFNNELARMLNMSMINSHSSLIDKPELTKEDLSDVISRLEDTIRKKESIEIIDDERGKRVYKKRLNARTEILNNRRRIQGRGI